MTGPIGNGLKLEIKPLKNNYSAGSLPAFEVTITNVSQKDILFCKYCLKHRLLTSLLTQNGFEVMPFTKTPKEPLKDKDFINLKPKENLKESINLKENKGYGILYAGSLPPVVDQKLALKGLPAGNYQFQTFIGNYINFYSAPEGTYNYSRNRKKILTEVPKKNITLDISKAWTGEMQAICQVTFS